MTIGCTGNTLLGGPDPPRRMPAASRTDARHATAIDAAAVFRQAATAMVVTDPRMRILAANPAYAALTGLAEFEAIGTTLPGARHAGDADPWESVVHHSGGQVHTVWMGQRAVRDRQARCSGMWSRSPTSASSTASARPCATRRSMTR